MDRNFWFAVDTLVAKSEIMIDRPKGSIHPRHPTVVYPQDYGYLVGTRSGDQGEVDLWIGGLEGQRVTGIVCTIDLDKGDAEIKFLLGCTEKESQEIVAFHNQRRQSGILIKRDDPKSTQT
jgi:inorganic pyrophosphatase